MKSVFCCNNFITILTNVLMRGILIENIKIALGSIKTQLLRTILTIVIIAIGITALVSILTAVAALDNTLTSDLASMGSNTFTIRQNEMQIRVANGRRNRNREQTNPQITYSQARVFQEKYNFPYTQTSLSFFASTNSEVKFGNKKTDPEVSVLGVDDIYVPNSGLEVIKGRNFTQTDITNNAKVCLVGSDFEKGLFKDESPLEKMITIRGSKFKIIGVLKEKGSTFGNNQDLRILLPFQVARAMFSQPGINYNLSVLVGKKELLNQAIDQAIITMRKIRKLNPSEEANFGIIRSDELIKQLLELTTALSISAWLIGIITIFGSSIALMNIMLVSVTERTREIGIRKALGAKRRTIAFQFFTETIVIGQLGGLLGIILGVSIGALFSSFLEFTFVIPWTAIFAAITTSFIVALVSGLYPAIKASKLDPIEALRYE